MKTLPTDAQILAALKTFGERHYPKRRARV